jgi:FkbM family methyltransferase
MTKKTNDTRISYAQNREDLILDGFFDKAAKGFYVDVGANHPVHESVTKLFYDRGWWGMNIEPTEWLFKLLSADRPRDINVQVGVSDKEGSMPFREYPNGDGLSTFSAEMQKQYEKADGYFTHEYREYKVPVKTLAHIFAEYKVTTIDFMKVDIEGYEFEALNSNDWTKYRPKVLCIESNHIIKDWHDLVKKSGYELAFFDGLNEYFVAKEASDVIKKFSYPDRVLLNGSYTSWRDEKLRQNAEVERRLLAYELDEAHEAAVNARQAASVPVAVTSKLRHKLHGVDSRIESKLTRFKHPSAVDMALPVKPAKNMKQFAAQLQQQVAATAPVSSPGKTAALKQYRRSKQITRAAARAVKKAIR